MIISDIQCRSYSIPLITPLTIAGARLFSRECTELVITTSTGVCGVGELSPLPGFSPESYNDANIQLLGMLELLKGAHIPESLDELALFSHDNLQDYYPSVRNAVEMALYSCICQLLEHDTCQISLNGLIMADAENRLAAVEQLLLDGYKSIKVKVGKESVEDDIAFVKSVLKIIDGKATLRMDANRSWSLGDAVRFGEAVACEAIEYIEEPVAGRENQAEFYKQTGIAVALDETIIESQVLDFDVCVSSSCCGLLAEACSDWSTKVGAMTLSSPKNRDELCDLQGGGSIENIIGQGVAALVIKPMLVGGIVKARELVRLALNNGIVPVLSCCFESDTAVRAYALLADELRISHIPQGLDTWKWLGSHNRGFLVNSGVMEVV